MGKRSVLVWPLAILVILLITVFFLVNLLPSSTDESVCRELREVEIRPLLKSITNLELPTEGVEDLRGIFQKYRGVESLFLAFKISHKSIKQVIDVFGGSNVLTREFPVTEMYPFQGDLHGFYRGYQHQQELGVDLFDINLCEKIKRDQLERAETGRYPEDAVVGYHLELNASPGLAFYRVLVFKKQGQVYFCADKSPKGGVHWR